MDRRKSMFVASRKPSRISAFEVFPVEPVPAESSKKIVYETSHPLGPKKPFSRDRAEKIMKETVEEMLEGEPYDEDNMGVIAKGISNEIREKLKNLYQKRTKVLSSSSDQFKKETDYLITDTGRFKFVVTVLIVEEKQQDLVLSRKQLHSADSDASAEMIYRSPTFVAYVYTVAFYQE